MLLAPLFTLIFLLLGVAVLVPHLFWKEVIEGQLEKQSFVVHMTESFMKGDLFQGFPMRYFIDPWHQGPGPWAEEVPLFHVLSSQIAKLFNVNVVVSGRIVSFIFTFVLLGSVFSIARKLFPERKGAPWFAAALFLWFPAIQLYSTSVMPDMAMLSLIALGYSLSLKNRVGLSYVSLLFACAFKYFAAFSILALFIFDWFRFKDKRSRLKAFAYSTLAFAPTAAYLVYFIKAGIPNPVTEYQAANGYGHLAGPFLFQLKFYSRFLTWVSVKSPNLLNAAMAVYGGWTLQKNGKRDLGGPWGLVKIHFFCQVLFALVFASSFFVHDYYALPFLLSTGLFAVNGYLNLKWDRITPVIFIGAVVFTFFIVKGTTLRQTNYLKAATDTRQVLENIPDRSKEELTIFVSDYSTAVLPVLTDKAGWAFSSMRLSEEKVHFHQRVNDPRVKAVIFYARQPYANSFYEELRNADERIRRMKVVLDRSYEEETDPKSVSRLVILQY